MNAPASSKLIINSSRSSRAIGQTSMIYCGKSSACLSRGRLCLKSSQTTHYRATGTGIAIAISNLTSSSFTRRTKTFCGWPERVGPSESGHAQGQRSRGYASSTRPSKSQRPRDGTDNHHRPTSHLACTPRWCRCTQRESDVAHPSLLLQSLWDAANKTEMSALERGEVPNFSHRSVPGSRKIRDT